MVNGAYRNGCAAPTTCRSDTARSSGHCDPGAIVTTPENRGLEGKAVTCFTTSGRFQGLIGGP